MAPALGVRTPPDAHRPRSDGRRRALLWVLVLAFCLRAGFAVATLALAGRGGFHDADTPTYVEPARELLESRRFAAGGFPELFRTPGYPALLALAMRAGDLEIVTVAVQVLLGTATTALVFALARRLCGDPRAGLAAAALYALEPLSILFGSKLLAETLFTSVFLLSVLGLTAFLESALRRDLTLSAVALAASAYVRPITAPLPLPLGVLLVLASPAPRLRGRLLHGAVFALVAASLLLPWVARNRAVAGYAGFCALGEVALYFYDGAAIVAEREGVPLEVVQARMGFTNPAAYETSHPEQRDWPPARRYAYQGAAAWALAREHPRPFVENRLRGMVRTLVPGAGQFAEHLGFASSDTGRRLAEAGVAAAVRDALDSPGLLAWKAAVTAHLAAVLALALAGAWAARRAAPAVVVVVLLGYLLAASGGPNGTSRFRHPMMPLFCALAGGAAARLTARSSARTRPAPRNAAGT